MKLSYKEYEQERRRGEATLLGLGIDLAKQGTYDCRTTRKRYSVFRGRISAVWDDAHFKKIPFGEFEVVG